MTDHTFRALYPEIEPFDSGRLAVSERHTLYYEQCGRPDGKPVVFLHGGPGGGCAPASRRFFDPERYRIVLFDQRGCGRSTPHADLVDNTTQHLVADIERLRQHLAVDRWQVFGGSWGSTLALAYAEAHPQRVTELVLRGIFMLRRAEMLWFYQQGANALFPDAFEAYRDHIPAAERGDMIGAYYRRLTSDDPEVRMAAARHWSTWEGATSHLQPSRDYLETTAGSRFALAFARIECHYFVHGGFFEHDDQLLREIDRIRHIPTVIVHGRYDVVCPLANAWDLHRAWPEAELRISPAAGHSAFEPANRHALLEATDRFAARD
ncbi:prolyl aminopeptidase [Salinisphaera orenii]|uniref:Proline iminopeptidase n=1 Tax=Salinisphaera orenii YIM 95161 TaxID=1051139 RepID=A0A423PE18_9GAMM|nr:prolyl aminopeptidase [Salinisphaera halophila]ROO23891.1 proline iminopeptidase [Salinisphaera halophila YIM 95161]